MPRYQRRPTSQVCKSTRPACRAILYTFLEVQSHVSVPISWIWLADISRDCRNGTHSTHSTVCFSGRTVHLISKSFDIVETVADDYRLWCEISSDARKDIRSARFLLFTTYTSQPLHASLVPNVFKTSFGYKGDVLSYVLRGT